MNYVKYKIYKKYRLHKTINILKYDFDNLWVSKLYITQNDKFPNLLTTENKNVMKWEHELHKDMNYMKYELQKKMYFRKNRNFLRYEHHKLWVSKLYEFTKLLTTQNMNCLKWTSTKYELRKI